MADQNPEGPGNQQGTEEPLGSEGLQNAEQSGDPYLDIRSTISNLYETTEGDLKQAQQEVSEKRKNLFERLIKTPGKKLLTAGTALTISSILWQTSPVEMISEVAKMASPIINPLLELGKIPIEKIGTMVDKLKIVGLFGINFDMPERIRRMGALLGLNLPEQFPGGPIQQSIFALVRLFYNSEQSANISIKITKFLATPFITIFGKNSLLVNPITNMQYFSGITPITPILFPLIGAFGVYKAFKILKRKYIEYSPTAQIREREREQLLARLREAKERNDAQEAERIRKALKSLNERITAVKKIVTGQNYKLTERQKALLGLPYEAIPAVGQ